MSTDKTRCDAIPELGEKVAKIVRGELPREKHLPDIEKLISGHIANSFPLNERSDIKEYVLKFFVDSSSRVVLDARYRTRNLIFITKSNGSMNVHQIRILLRQLPENERKKALVKLLEG